MDQRIAHVALVVRDYDEAIAFFTRKLRFTLVEDSYQPAQDKRWVVVAPPGSVGADGPTGTTLLLARASSAEQERFIGNQAGGRVFLFLQTEDFWRDYEAMIAAGVTFIRPPTEQSYGTVAVFEDLYGNRWDLVQMGDTRGNDRAPAIPYSVPRHCRTWYTVRRRTRADIRIPRMIGRRFTRTASFRASIASRGIRTLPS